MKSNFSRISLFVVAAILLSIVPQTAAAQGAGGFADPAFQRVWERTDAPVASGAAVRSWYWGPEPGLTTSEPYAEGEGGVRKVQYFDKSRMEINDPTADPNGLFFVTNGLLTVELIRGRIQVGDETFQQSVPANIPVAGDTNDANAPTYASFASALTLPKQNMVGKKLNQVISRSGQITTDMSYDVVSGTEIAYYDEITGRNIPTVFWNFVNASGAIQVNGQIGEGKLSDPWFFATGLPVAEAYWATVKIAGVDSDVLIQPFERRVLTYVPTNDPAWQVEMGNIGRHYYNWRYNGQGRDPLTGATPVTTPVSGTPVASPTVAPPSATAVACNTPPSVSSTVDPLCGPSGTVFTFSIFGFQPNEDLSYWFTTPDGEVIGTEYPIPGQHPGSLELPFPSDGLWPGVWSLTFQGAETAHQSISYFTITEEQAPEPGITPTPSGPVDTSVPASVSGTVNPSFGPAGTIFEMELFGFNPNEEFSYWLTGPDQAVYPSEQRFNADAEGRQQLTFASPFDLPTGIWSVTFHGIESNHETIIYFRITP